MSGDLERRYRRVLRLLPGWYRERWEQDMVAAFLDSWLTGDPEADAYIARAAGPGWGEAASVARLAIRLHLSATEPARRRAWGEAIRRAVLAATLVQATRGLDILVRVIWGRHLFGWLPVAPPGIVPGTAGTLPPVVWYLVAYAWIVVFALLVLRYYRSAQVLAALAIVPDLVTLIEGQVTGRLPAPYIGPWAFLVLINLALVLAMTAFLRRGVTPPVRWPALLALPTAYLAVYAPLLVLQVTGNYAWMPDFSGLYCMLVALACVAQALRAWSRPAAWPGAWPLALVVLAADAGAYRIFSTADYLQYPHLVGVCLAELLILLAAVALVFPAARAETGTSAPAPDSRPQPLSA
jgi:hypothetical protein